MTRELTVGPRAPSYLLQNVGEISAAFLWPTRHRVVSTITVNQLTVTNKTPKTPPRKALYVTLMDVKHKAACEQPLATIDVKNSITWVFAYGLLLLVRCTTQVQEHLAPRKVECARQTTSLSRKGRKEQAVRVACAGCVYTNAELSHFEGNQDWRLHRDQNRSMLPII
jgi:hypothetical protein